MKLIELIEARGADVNFYDPHIAIMPKTRAHEQLARRSSISWTLDRLRSYHAVVIAADHDAVDYLELCRSALLVIDTRNACARDGWVGDNVIKAWTL